MHSGLSEAIIAKESCLYYPLRLRTALLALQILVSWSVMLGIASQVSRKA